ncbi:MAG: aspartate aminotransferase family protein [Treponema sp.]|nr:aspartate aminotransferase family protein [Candidatus Treponema caballi]
MTEKDLFITENDADKQLYEDIITRTAKAIKDAFINDKAYTGPEPFDLKKVVEAVEILPDEGIGFENAFDRLNEVVLPNLLRTPSADYMAHLHGPSLLETIASELVISTFNQSMDSWDQSPVATEIEVAVIRELCRLFGYTAAVPASESASVPESVSAPDGVFTSGGSQSNETALLIARDWFCNEKLHLDVKKFGLPENFTKLRLYTSEISHFSMEKACHIMGLGYQSVVKVPVDEKQKMDIAALKHLLASDVAAGNIPFCVVATCGTTDFGSIDPMKEIAALCEEYGMWMHVDAAYGSGVIMSDDYRARVADIALSDSVTVDFHKMFMMPVSCSAVLIKDGRDMQALTIHADYLNREEDEEDGYTNLVDKSIQTTRRFDALKVWLSFQIRGRNGWSTLISTSMNNAAYLYGQFLQDPAFAVVTEPEISSVVFRLAPPSESAHADALKSGNGAGLLHAAEAFRWDEVNKKVRRSLIHEHGVVIGQTVAGGRVCLKFTLLNPRITHEKLDALLSLIKTLGARFSC